MWLVGSFFAVGPGPLLLVALYVVFLAVLPGRVARGALSEQYDQAAPKALR
ncbi:hypothetical protein [Dactylosporangium sp. NPDC049140]|uniref:hypothetical protein n=1 Tax=Dactylosporangium sp. NPDC049140 TaxID=3155647 RepID=UPI003409CD1B